MGGQQWDCPACTFINVSTARRCEICMTPTPDQPAPSASTPAPPSLPPVVDDLTPATGEMAKLGLSDQPVLAHLAEANRGGEGDEFASPLQPRLPRSSDLNKTRSPYGDYKRLCLDLDLFVGLPSELNAVIFGLLAVKDIVNLSLVCRWLCDEIARNDYIWRQMFLKTYQKEERFILMEGLDNGMARTGWRRAFKLQFYLQVMADLSDLLSESKFYLVHTSLKHDPKHITTDRGVGAEEGGQFAVLYRWRGERFNVSLADVPTAVPNADDDNDSPARPSRPGDWIDDVGTLAEWDEEFQTNLQSRIKKCPFDEERDEVIALGTTWIGKGPVVRQVCEQFIHNIVRRDYEDDAAIRRMETKSQRMKGGGKEIGKGKEKVEENEDHDGQGREGTKIDDGEKEREIDDEEGDGDEDDVDRDTLQGVLSEQTNWKERDRGCARRLMVKMLAKSPPINPPYITLPFDAWKVAKEYVDSVLDLFEVGERGCARYFCLAQEFETGAADRFLVLGVMAVSPHRAVFFTSLYGLTLAQLDAIRMHKYMAEVDTEGYGYEDEEEQEVALPDGPWACPLCTYVNYDSKYKCDVCDNYRSSKRTDIA